MKQEIYEFDDYNKINVIRLNRKVPIKIETWGACGGTSGYGGLGGYSSAEMVVDKSDILYIFVGGMTGANGGGSGHSKPSDAGGGASDVRLNSTSLDNRIIVAGGGGGFGGRLPTYGGYGGGLVGGTGTQRCGTPGLGGTQSSGGTGGTNNGSPGYFGHGGSNLSGSNSGGGGGGGGWYGGGAGGNDYPRYNDIDDSGGGGGSSYVSSIMTNSQIIPGDSSMPSPSGGTQTGQNGNGYVRITVIDTTRVLFQKEGLYYIPTKEYFNTTTKSFNPISITDVIDEQPDILNNSINIPFTINRVTYKPLDYIDINKCKICIITSINNFSNINIKYTLSDTVLSKTTIKVKPIWTQQNVNNGYFNIYSTGSINYKLDYYDYSVSGNSNIIDIEKLKSFYTSFTFTKELSVLSSCGLYSVDKVSYNKIKDNYLSIEKNIANMYITFDRNYNNIYLNKVNKVDYKYINTTLETF